MAGPFDDIPEEVYMHGPFDDVVTEPDLPFSEKVKGRRQSDNVRDSRGPSPYKDAVNLIESIADWAEKHGRDSLSDQDYIDYNNAVRIVKQTEAHAENAGTRTYPDPPPQGQLAYSAVNKMSDVLYDHYNENSKVPVPRPRPLGY